ncbi:hypothetical protein HUO13_28360 [Saccharopolyspora erythraea]|uniref:hypothetical protein n=1 Tax=Saccharopolyspora erythraea TaxID=1836 RepID=UPI001BAA9C99|nr:hypothetical protein [Saccharopolyspora erythraea]QUH04187.1 hypothetical protein HUO13_28360 [Saccharopolyspora erythraea]
MGVTGYAGLTAGDLRTRRRRNFDLLHSTTTAPAACSRSIDPGSTVTTGTPLVTFAVAT